MTSRDFCYWLQGFFEISNEPNLCPEQVEVIRNHLKMVFYHEIDPSMGNEKKQEVLNELHGTEQSSSPGGFSFEPSQKTYYRC